LRSRSLNIISILLDISDIAYTFIRSKEKRMTTISELAARVEEMMADVQNGLPTQYAIFNNDATATTWKIRVANHDANPERTDNHTISFIVPVKEKETGEDDTCQPFHVNKKSFASVPQQYVIVDGCDENGYSVEHLLTYHID
jgi:hypothetical protein